MGFLGKLFEKKVCDICGGEIGMLGNRKLDDGNLCKNCAKELSPWFSDRRHSTVEEIRQQLAYREDNKKKVQMFQSTRDFKGSNAHVFIDDQHGWFTIASRINVENNPDILELSQITSCRLDVEQDRTEEQYRDQNGEMRDYVPPRYKYSYKYKMMIGINSPWFDDMDFQLHNFDIDANDRGKIMAVEQIGNQIIAALSGGNMAGNMNTGMYGQQPGMMGNTPMHGNQQPGMMNQGAYGQQGNMNAGMYGQQAGMMNQGAYGQQPGMMNQGMYGQQPGMMNQGNYDPRAGVPNQDYSQPVQGNPAAAGGAWVCSCGASNTGRFCEFCGQPKPNQ